MEEFREKSEEVFNKVKVFICKTIRPKSIQVHASERLSEPCRNINHLRNGNLTHRRERAITPETLSEITQNHSAQKLPKKKPLSSEQARANISHISTLAERVSARSQQTLQRRRRSYDIPEGEQRINIPVEDSKTFQKPKPKRRTKLAIMILVSGTLFGIFQRELIEVARDSLLVVEKNGFFTKIWSDVPVGLNICIFAFSLKNARSFYNGAKPKLEKMGPYCYNAYRKRELLEWTDKTVTFREGFKLQFNPENSEPLDKEITAINVPIYGSILFANVLLERFYLKFAGPIVFNLLNRVLQATGERPIERFPVGEFMNGRKINLVVLLDKFLDPLRRMGVQIPEYGYGGYKIVNQSYGIASLIDNAQFGPIEAYRRSEDGKHVGDIVGLQGETTWPGIKSPCNRLESSDGAFYPRPVTQKELTLFFYIACRLLKFVKVGEQYNYGALLTRYAVDKNMFTMKDRSNHCFCRKGMPLSACEGLSDMSPCFFGLPLELSLPNFIHYPNLQRQIDGLDYDAEKYDGYIDIDPYLGSPVNAKLFLMGSLHMTQIRSVPVLENIREVPFPLLLIEINEGMNYRKMLIPVIFILSNYLRYGAFIWFGISASIAGTMLFRRRK